MRDLINLYKITSKSEKEENMRVFLKRYLHGITSVNFYLDDMQNIYITKGFSATYPCIVAHYDEVHDNRPKDYSILEHKGVLLGVSSIGHVGIGADDKNGIWIALRCLEKYDVMKCVLFVGEEVGGIGSYACDISFFDDCRFVLECDRRGNSDFVTSINGLSLCSRNFLKDANLKNYGYSKAFGMFTDVFVLKQRGLNISCCNMSCGYYNPHSSTEFTIFDDLIKCFNLVCHIIENCTKVYAHKSTYNYRNIGMVTNRPLCYGKDIFY